VREKLLAAADACDPEKGPVRTRMSDIARRAGVHRSTVYYYFAQKDTLLAASRPRLQPARFAATFRLTRSPARSSGSTSASLLSLQGPKTAAARACCATC
jgi:hypothetical protein